ncbi:hypothetical protein PC9H_001872 [Pleurotus ostreatus]|uniref:Uncharacterized protein n=1 Tax=Pleurotus ostreatus TaxID=5322 RepID=A0A8H7DM35_PLEOS|nr:uncharacterized protein PC9H_001872 [Pleurotus ostreatus]KAF7419285.1 hypothetical protein PC9H_001872 [Pleurotus ostreatus]
MPTTQAPRTIFISRRHYWPAMDTYFKKFGKDATAKVAHHCAKMTTNLLQQTPLYSKQHAFSTPRTKLNVFVDRLLRETKIPLPNALATIRVIRWVTKEGLCPLSSSSPHHLFLATLRAVSHFASLDRGHDVDAQWVRHSGGVVRLNEIFLMRMELAELLPTLGERQWALLSNLGSENSTVDEHFDAECPQGQQLHHEGPIPLVETAGSSLLVYEQDSGSDSTHYDSQCLEGWHIEPVQYIHRREKIRTRARRVASRIFGSTSQTIPPNLWSLHH